MKTESKPEKPSKRRRGRTAKIIEGYLERKRRILLEKHYTDLKDILPHHRGIYALYRGDKLYYIGIARNVAGRLRGHLKDRHSRKWDYFSLYICRSLQTIRTLEKLFLRIARPQGNSQRGRVGGINLTERLSNYLISKQEKLLQSRK